VRYAWSRRSPGRCAGPPPAPERHEADHPCCRSCSCSSRSVHQHRGGRSRNDERGGAVGSLAGRVVGVLFIVGAAARSSRIEVTPTASSVGLSRHPDGGGAGLDDRRCRCHAPSQRANLVAVMVTAVRAGGPVGSSGPSCSRAVAISMRSRRPGSPSLKSRTRCPSGGPRRHPAAAAGGTSSGASRVLRHGLRGQRRRLPRELPGPISATVDVRWLSAARGAAPTGGLPVDIPPERPRARPPRRARRLRRHRP
jgi:hypothetical protein